MSNPNINVSNIGAVPLSQKGLSNGVASLDANGAIPAAQLANAPQTFNADGLVVSGNVAVTNNLILAGGLRVPFNTVISYIEARVGTAPVGSGITIQIRKNGGSAALASVTIAAGTNRQGLSVSPNVPLIAGDMLQIDVTAIGSSTAGADLAVTITNITPSFSPTLLGNVLAWYRTESLITAGAVDGAGAPNWADSSGNGYGLVVNTSTNYFKANASNGHSGVQLGGGGFHLPGTGVPDPLGGLAAGTLFVSFAATATVSSGLFGRGDFSGFCLFNQNGTLRASATDSGGTAALNSAAGSISTGSHVGACTIGGGSLALRLDGTQVSTTSFTGPVIASGTTGAATGLNFGTNNAYNGYSDPAVTIFEAIAFNRKLNLSELTQVETYLNGRK